MIYVGFLLGLSFIDNQMRVNRVDDTVDGNHKVHRQDTVRWTDANTKGVRDLSDDMRDYLVNE